MSRNHTNSQKTTFGKRRKSKNKDLKRIKNNQEIFNKYKCEI